MNQFKFYKQNTRCVQIGIMLCIIIGMFTWNFIQTSESQNSQIHVSTRQLLSVLPNCTPRAIEQFPPDLFTAEQRSKGAITLHIFISLYMFLGFALICDDYFVPSLEVLCKVLNIQSDVAGATFMAAGSSAPELATAVIAVFIAKDDIGIGTVVGSAVYNVMFVISICALCAGMVVQLNWWPLFRDCLAYSLSVIALAVVIMDEKVYWYESLLFVCLYLLYIVLMYFNSSLESWFVPKFTCCTSYSKLRQAETVVLVDRQSDAQINGHTNDLSNTHAQKETAFISQGEWDDVDSDFEEGEDDTSKLLNNTTTQGTQIDDDTEVAAESVFTFPTQCWKRCVYVSALPLKLLFYISIPDCRLLRWRRCYIITFVMCLVWLSVLSYIMVWMITIIGYTAGIADTIMGLTFIAFGVSLPDVISSVIVVREGLGDMAVSNAVGSNVFDILICLGVPWLIQTCVNSGEPVQVYSEGLLYATLTLLVTVVFLLVSTHLNGWRLTKTYGVILMFVYVAFTALTSLYELNVFGYVHPAECIFHY